MTAEHEDKQLVEQAQQHPEHFAALYTKYVDRIFQYIYYKTGQHQDTAEDLTAEVFTRCLKNIAHFEWQGYPYSSYIYQVARSVCIEQYAQNEKQTVDIEEVIISGGSGENAALQTELHILWERVNELDPPLPEIFELRYIEDLPYEEIAVIIGKKPGAVRTSVSRALKKLQESYL